jgi:O-antigen/teichoic acid export membrane protein
MLKTLHSLALKSVDILWLLVVLLLVSPSKVSAYTDPGTGAFVYQAVYAAFIGGAFYFRKIMGKIWRKRK